MAGSTWPMWHSRSQLSNSPPPGRLCRPPSPIEGEGDWRRDCRALPPSPQGGGLCATWRLRAYRALGLALLAALLSLGTLPARAGPALLFEPETGGVLHAYEVHQRWHPASLAKLMTLYLVFEGLKTGDVRPETPVVLSERAAAVTINTMGWPAGTEISMADTIPLLAVKSANDVAVAVAETLGGSLDGFVAGMNAKAAALGMSDTNFANPHGLHDARQHTTAHDLAVLIEALIREFPEHQPVFAMQQAEVRGESFTSFNRLLGRFPGADGFKTGYVCSSGWNIAASATRDGRRLVAIVLGGLREGQREEIAATLLEAGFAGEIEAGLSLDALSRPAAADGPVDMRPYACEGRAPPARIASFGLDETPLPRPRPGGN